MSSAKRRNTSKSGGSAKSKKPATSPDGRNSSQTSAPSSEAPLELDGNPPDEQRANLQSRLEAALGRLERLRALPTPKVALFRTQRAQDISRHKRLIKQLTEALASL